MIKYRVLVNIQEERIDLVIFKIDPAERDGIVTLCWLSECSLSGLVKEVGYAYVRPRPFSQGHIYIVRGK